MNFKKATTLLLSLLLLMSVGTWFLSYAINENATWTFMVYLDADNNLDPAGVDDISEMQMVGSTDKVNIVVLFDRWHEKSGFNGTAMLYIYKGENETIWGGWTNEHELNMGDPEVLAWFISYVAAKYPADNYALIIWDHGGNWEGVCWDWTNGDYLTIKEVQEAIEIAGVKIDLLEFDACIMAGVEIAYMLKLTGMVDVMVASEDFVPWDGLPYELILADLVAHPEWDATAFAVCMVDRYVEYYSTQDVNRVFVTLSAMDLANMNLLVHGIKDLANELIVHFMRYRDAITAAKDAADRYWFGFWIQGAYIDLHQFTGNLSIFEENLKGLTDPILELWDDVVIYAKCAEGPHIRDGAGLTIYFPRNEEIYWSPDEYYESVRDFVEYTQWLTLLEMYFTEPINWLGHIHTLKI